MAISIHHFKRPHTMYSANTRVMSSDLCESPNYKHGTVYVGIWLSPTSHVLESHAFLIFIAQCNSFSVVTKFSPA